MSEQINNKISNSEYETLVTNSLKNSSAKEKSITTGKIISIDNDIVTIDVGLKSEGRIPISEFSRPGLKAEIEIDGINHEISGSGNGPIDAFVNALNQKLSIDIKVSDYHQSAISSGSDAQAAAYIELQKGDKTSWGVGINPNTTKASFEAIIVGVAKLI